MVSLHLDFRTFFTRGICLGSFSPGVWDGVFYLGRTDDLREAEMAA